MYALGINIKCHYAECQYAVSIFSYCCTKHHCAEFCYVNYCFAECCGTKILEWINVIVKSRNVDIKRIVIGLMTITILVLDKLSRYSRLKIL